MLCFFLIGLQLHFWRLFVITLFLIFLYVSTCVYIYKYKEFEEISGPQEEYLQLLGCN